MDLKFRICHLHSPLSVISWESPVRESGRFRALSAIVAFSDVHLGYDQTDYDRFMEFLQELQSRDDLADVVIVGDLIDLWRRDVVGLEFALSRYMEALKMLQKKVNVHYVVGNHDFHIGSLKNHDYTFKPQSSLAIERFSYTVRFLHGHQCDPLQNILGPDTSEILCWTLSDDIGEAKSKLWDLFGGRSKLSRAEFEEKVDALMSPPEDVRRSEAFGFFDDFVECIKAYLKVAGEKEFIVYGHTHKPFIDLNSRVANTGCWIKGASPVNTYFEFAEWPPRIMEFKRKPLIPSTISKLRF
jgi:UDP-2,3-diacylglucosamine pyrophosphatase LpxH